MPQKNSSWYGTSGNSRSLTTLLAGGWGLSSAYILFHSILISHDSRPAIVSFIPLVIVWATLERKRWGRLALVGLSATSLGLFVSGVGYLVAFGNYNFTPSEKDLAHYSQLILRMYSGAPTVTYLTLVLALTTNLWMRLPSVVAEFERGKRATLAKAQHAIAFSLVSSWAALVLIMTPSLKAMRAPLPLAGRGHEMRLSPKHTPTRRASLVDAASSIG
jgi:hypothetical protein